MDPKYLQLPASVNLPVQGWNLLLKLLAPAPLGESFELVTAIKQQVDQAVITAQIDEARKLTDAVTAERAKLAAAATPQPAPPAEDTSRDPSTTVN